VIATPVSVFSEFLPVFQFYLVSSVSVDGLTGIANRRVFDELLSREWVGHVRRSTPLALILCDIDFFKQYNDFYGHVDGDTALRKVSQYLSGALHREVDTVARYGGEEFAIVLPDTDLEWALKIAERVNAAVRDLQIPSEESPECDELTLSCGVAATVPNDALKPKDLIALADSALYTAKDTGRNRVVAASQGLPGQVRSYRHCAVPARSPCMRFLGIQ
jgi:two-component system cell cycle response regulator